MNSKLHVSITQTNLLILLMVNVEGHCQTSGRGESKRHAIRALSEPYPLVTITARKMSELKVPISADKGSR